MSERSVDHRSGVEHPHLCYEGWVFLGYEVPTPDGDVEVIHERVRCRRCAEEEAHRVTSSQQDTPHVCNGEKVSIGQSVANPYHRCAEEGTR